MWTAPGQIGAQALVARRPEVFFDPKGFMPEKIALAVTAPPGFASADEFRSLLSAELSALEEKHQRALAARGRRFLGVARVLAQDSRASPPPGEPRFELKPRIAARDKWKRIEALSRLKSWVSEYREALRAWTAGVRTVVFPAGTYQLRVLHGVQCAGAA